MDVAATTLLVGEHPTIEQLMTFNAAWKFNGRNQNKSQGIVTRGSFDFLSNIIITDVKRLPDFFFPIEREHSMAAGKKPGNFSHFFRVILKELRKIPRPESGDCW